MKTRIYLTILTIIAIGFAMSFSTPAGDGKLIINFNHYVGDKTMEFDTVSYANELGQPFIITKFKYYIGNPTLHSKDGRQHRLAGYFLINEEEQLSKKIQWSEVPAGEYTELSFTLGVDSADNCTGLQSGALDPINAMFWTWNTGYVFLKLEGKSPVSTSPGKILEYHIGGFKAPANSIRTINITFSLPLVVGISRTSTLQLKVDASEILKTPITIDFTKFSSVTDAHNAPMIADNYKDMFSLISIN